MALNRIILQGRIGKDPELRSTPGGVAVASTVLAVDRDFKDKQTGEKVTDWIDVMAWRGAAEFLAKHFSKGRMAVVEGRLQIREWTDKEGNKRRSAEVVADNIYFGDAKRDDVRIENESVVWQRPKNDAPAAGEQFAELAGDDGDLPF